MRTKIIKQHRMLRYCLLVPLALLVASVVAGWRSYADAREDIADDLNEAMIALANENRNLWTRQDTVAALRTMHETTRKPVIYQASDVNFRNPNLKDKAYIAVALADKYAEMPKINGDKIASDSIILVTETDGNSLAIRVQGFADCSMASVFSLSDQRVPGVLFALSLLSMTSVFVWRKKDEEFTIDSIKLTPMQRQLVQMLLDAPGRKVDKQTLCCALWGNKSNAEESLYTLVRRTKSALAEANAEIVCNRGESYELRINV